MVAEVSSVCSWCVTGVESAEPKSTTKLFIPINKLYAADSPQLDPHMVRNKQAEALGALATVLTTNTTYRCNHSAPVVACFTGCPVS